MRKLNSFFFRFTRHKKVMDETERYGVRSCQISKQKSRSFLFPVDREAIQRFAGVERVGCTEDLSFFCSLVGLFCGYRTRPLFFNSLFFLSRRE